MTAAAGGGASLQCIGLVHVYRAAGTDTAALRGIDLTVHPGDHVALLGPSGSGKSTLLAVIAGIRQPSAGQVLLDGHDIARLTEKPLRGYRAGTVGILLQGAVANLLPYANAEDNVRHIQPASHPRRRRGRSAPPPAELLRALGLPAGAHRTPVSALPPSQQQTVAVAVALALAPRLLVADEPTSQLDEPARDALLDALLTITADLGTTVLIVTHDADVAARMDRTLHLRDGRIGAEARATAAGRQAERFTVIGADGALLIPDQLAAAWPGGTYVRVDPARADELRITRVREP